MYPPIIVVVLALTSFTKQTFSLETVLRLEALDGDGEGGGGDTYSTFYDEDKGLASESDEYEDVRQQQNQEQPSVQLDEVYYRVTSATSHESEGSSSSSSSTTSNTILGGASEEQLSATERTRNTSSEDQQHISNHEGKVSVAEAFVRDDPQIASSRDALSSRSLDHEAADSLQSSTVLETSLSSNFLYTSGTYNDSFHLTNPDDSSEKTSDEVALDSVEDDAQTLATTTNIPALSVPDDVALKPTKPQFDESKISKTELLTRIISDKNLRLPIAFLVDTCNDSLSYSKKVFDASLIPKSPLEVILMRYNSTGIAKSTSFRNTKSLMDAINVLQPSYDSSGRAYYGILRTSQEIPYDSAIFLATSNAATDKELARMAALTLLKKRIRLYVVWFGDEVDTNVSDQHLDSQNGLHELAYKTGGRVIRFEIDHQFGNNPVLTTLVSENELHGDQSIPISVAEDVNSLYFKLHGSLATATLRTPNGYIIDLLRNTVSSDVSKVDSLYTDPSELPLLEIIADNRTEHHYHHQHQPGKNATKSYTDRIYLVIVNRLRIVTAGVHYLNLSAIKDLPELLPADHQDDSNRAYSVYGVIVKAEHNMRHGIELLELGNATMERHFDDHSSNEVESILLDNELDALVDSSHSRRSQKQTRHTSTSDDEELRSAQQQTSPEEEESGSLGRAAIQPITKIDIGINSQLMGTRGSTLQLSFEVTNFRQAPMFYYFRVNDELGFLRTLNPGSATLGPEQTISVVVTMVIGTNAEVGARDKVTFSTEGADRVQQSAWVTVTDAAGLPDAYQPSIWYTYTSRCEGRSTAGTCTGAFWTVDITARDYETGLMRISSSPRGIVYKAPFTIGTRDEVKASYTASCCQPKVSITAHDISKNARSINLDVTDIWLNEAGIAAVVLGVLLLIALIILLIILIRWCIRRRQSRELPIYRGDARGTRQT
ncbi:uncharacterized protein LOC129765852 isoform X1 [Toxorhynchites rutilus septentrionalis]|uniref:uncharacterized protein LOC129765852 isoform X1 n=1 Tax=Toxorhynchites rutilus septentrionalis TaxID=329112 RepID=UPI00247AEB58|nr:uncharacterized protein LOC129765852 isoform X1 [Toxorhynchites rutilus septentrionalis]XP_055622351.1 uncharacterized protein LOC129765852 isoform X1 [Toxorhynchites rutilus septentrionalis]XP_055622415.1 uncharacterized protein LOC129765852 isoform X1 [Toxorhynchites rutilus septentrionalis]XP_055622463.1 uncharacterized protein LOC129765852 isoform X1 [Toxorhynchites rutilus septentrionalis]XP_055622501.1 uncharacterized protein LOC129765852 isoform X1 [Toxorhynchites rutilus septentriona